MKNKNIVIKNIITGLILLTLFSCSHAPEKTALVLPVKKETAKPVKDTLVKIDTLITTELNGIEFGYCSEDGSQLMVTKNDTLLNADKLTKVISNKGELADVTFVERRPAGKNDNGRQTYYNFKNAGGYLYKVTNAKANKENSVAIFSDEFLTDRELIMTSNIIKNNLSKEIKDQIEKDKNHKIKKATCLKQIDNNKSVYVIEFSNNKDTALASLIYVDSTKIIYKDFPAKYDAMSTWRVDDGGIFEAGSLKVLAVFNHKNKIELIIDWAGAEGYNTDYYIEENGKFTSAKNGYRYCAPE